MCGYLGELMNLVGVDLEGGGRCWKETLALERGPSTNQSSPLVGGNAWQRSEMPEAPGASKFYFLFLNHPVLSLIHCPPGFCSLVPTLARVLGDTIVKSSRHFCCVCFSLQLLLWQETAPWKQSYLSECSPSVSFHFFCHR